MAWRSRVVVPVLILGVGTVALSASSDEADPPKQSAHLLEVTGTNYERLPQEVDPLVLRWDFSGDKIYAYNLENIADSSSSLTKNSADSPIRMTSKGVLEIKSQGDGTGRVVLRDVTMTMEGLGEDALAEPMTSHSQPVVVQGMQEDGSFGLGNAATDAMFRLIFPLPSQPLTVGETATIPFVFPVNVMGSPLEAHGSVSVVLSGLVYARGHQCAQLDSRIEVQNVELPDEITATFRLGVSGQGRYFFDVEEHRLLEATVAVTMSMETSFPNSDGLGFSGDDEDGTSEMSVFSDTLIRVTSE